MYCKNIFHYSVIQSVISNNRTIKTIDFGFDHPPYLLFVLNSTVQQFLKYLKFFAGCAQVHSAGNKKRYHFQRYLLPNLLRKYVEIMPRTTGAYTHKYILNSV